MGWMEWLLFLGVIIVAAVPAAWAWYEVYRAQKKIESLHALCKDAIELLRWLQAKTPTKVGDIAELEGALKKMFPPKKKE